MNRLSAGIAVLALAMGASVQAGELLKFQKGSVDLREVSHVLTTAEADTQIWIVQMKTTISSADQKALKAAGARVYRYIPDDALVVRGSKAQIVQRLGDRLQGLMPYRGDFKLSENLPAAMVMANGSRSLLSVTVVDEQEVAATVAAIQKLDPQARVMQSSGRFLDMSLSLSILPRLSEVSGIEFVENRSVISPLNVVLDDDVTPAPQGTGDYKDLNGFETGTKVMNFDSAWQAGFTGQDQIVAMADTGLDMGDNAQLSPDFQGFIAKGFSFGIGAKGWEDPMGHGTHVAGSVMGRGVTSKGGIHGGAYGAKFVPQGMWSPIIDNLTVPPKLATLFASAYQEGARIHTNSWGAAANLGAYDAMAQQADDFLWNNPQMVILFAAGNSGVDKDKDGVIDSGSTSSPGTAKNVLTVGASENQVSSGGIQKQVKELRPAKESWPAEPISSSYLSDNPNGIACFSSRGPTRDGRLKPEIVAPGTNILSNFSHVAGASTLWGAYNADYAWSGGTSMATPLAAGATTVAREMLVKKFGQADPSGALLKGFMMHTAKDLFPGQYGEGTATQEMKTRRPNNEEGYGRVDMAQATALTTATTRLVDSAGVGVNEAQTFEFDLKAGQKLLANLVYFDAPGTPAAAAALVNDLDLVLVTPAGQEIASHDKVNNHEIIEKSDLAAGHYKLVVKGVNVPMGKNGKQPFALLYTVQ